ncbi:MAG: ComEC/Rec2 family competence protein [Thermomicrobiaceae bacterium]
MNFPRRNRASRRTTFRRFNLFVLGVFVLSAGILTFVFQQIDEDSTSDQGELEGDSIATIAFMDVGQGLSTVIVTEDGRSLVHDFGPGRDHAEQTIGGFLNDHDIDQVDYAILSHPHQDHLGGLPAFLEAVSVSRYIDPALESTNQTYAQSLEIIEDQGIEGTIARQGDTYSLGEHVELEILWPTDQLITESNGEHNMNENSTVVRVDIGDVSLLLTGDIEQEAENTLVESMSGALDVDILQVSHHGSNSSSQDHFLAATSPELAAISAGADNQYGHPHAEVIERLRGHEIQIYRTDVDGTVIIQTDGESWDVATTGAGQSWIRQFSPQHWIASNVTSMTTSSPFWYSMIISN